MLSCFAQRKRSSHNSWNPRKAFMIELLTVDVCGVPRWREESRLFRVLPLTVLLTFTIAMELSWIRPRVVVLRCLTRRRRRTQVKLFFSCRSHGLHVRTLLVTRQEATVLGIMAASLTLESMHLRPNSDCHLLFALQKHSASLFILLCGRWHALFVVTLNCKLRRRNYSSWVYSALFTYHRFSTVHYFLSNLDRNLQVLHDFQGERGMRWSES